MDVLFQKGASRLMDACRIGPQGSEVNFPVFPPVYFRLGMRVKSQIVDFLSRLKQTVGLQSLPPSIRIDFLFSADSLYVVEVNTDAPAGIFFLWEALVNFGLQSEADKVRAGIAELIPSRQVIFLSYENDVTSPWEYRICRKMFPEKRLKYVEVDKEPPETDENAVLYRMATWRYQEVLTRWDAGGYNYLVNPLYSWKMADKLLLDQINSPLVLPGEKVKLQNRITVPSGWVAKTALGNGGKEVYFAGEVIKPGTYLFQEYVRPICYDFGDGPRKISFDLYVIHGEPRFACCRNCLEQDNIVNVSSGGGYSPAVVHFE